MVDKDGVIIVEQAGYRDSYSTVYCILILYSVINIISHRCAKLYTACFNFHQAFDYIDRPNRLCGINCTHWSWGHFYYGNKFVTIVFFFFHYWYCWRSLIFHRTWVLLVCIFDYYYYYCYIVLFSESVEGLQEGLDFILRLLLKIGLNSKCRQNKIGYF